MRNAKFIQFSYILTLLWGRSVSYHRSKSLDWFLYDRDLCHERIDYSHLQPSILVTQLSFTFQMLTIETLEQGVKYVQS